MIQLSLDQTKAFLLRYKTILLLAGVVLLAWFLLRPVLFKPTIITVIGTGKLEVAPAKVEMTVTRVDSSVDPVVAVNQGETNTKVLIDDSKVLLGEPDIQRAFYQITPTVVGGDRLYQVVNVFRLTSTDPGKTSELIKSLYTKGAITITNVNFLPTEQEDVTQEARRLALQDAREQAKLIAKAAGKRIGRIVTITDDLNQASGTISSKENMEPNSMPSDFVAAAPDKIEVSKVVSVTYEIW
jgi:uncharacterized protein YggE